MAPFDTYPKIMNAIRSFARASRGCNLSVVGDPKDVDAKHKGQRKELRKGKARVIRKKRVQRVRTKTQLTTSQTHNASTIRPKDKLQGTARI